MNSEFLLLQPVRPLPSQQLLLPLLLRRLLLPLHGTSFLTRETQIVLKEVNALPADMLMTRDHDDDDLRVALPKFEAALGTLGYCHRVPQWKDDCHKPAQEFAPLRGAITYLDDQCGALCSKHTNPDLKKFRDMLNTSLLASLDQSGGFRENLETEVLLQIVLYADDHGVGHRHMEFAVISGAMGKGGRQTEDIYLWTLLQPPDSFDHRNFDIAGLHLKHRRHEFLPPASDPPSPFESDEGSLVDLTLDELLAQLVTFNIIIADPDADVKPRCVTVRRLLHSSRLHSEEPLEYYIIDEPCGKWKDISISMEAACNASPSPSPSLSSSSIPKPIVAKKSLLQTALISSGRSSSFPKSGISIDRARAKRGGDDETTNALEALLSGAIADVGNDIANDLQEALQMIDDEEGIIDGGDSHSGHSSGEEASPETDSDHGPESVSGASASDDIDDVVLPPPSKSGGKRKRNDPSTHGVREFEIPGLGSIVHSYGRCSFSAHCVNPAHNTGSSKCRMSRVAHKRALGACGAFLECAFSYSTKREHMAMARNKQFSYIRRVHGRASCVRYIPLDVLRDPSFERPRLDGEPEEPIEHA